MSNRENKKRSLTSPTPNATKKGRSTANTQPPRKTPDKASAVTNSNPTMDTSDQKTANPTPQPKTPKIPPIIIELSAWPQVTKSVMPLFDHSLVTANFTNNTMHILSNDTKNFRKIQSKLFARQITFHTFNLPDDRTLKTIIRGIPPSYLLTFLPSYEVTNV